ncbi:MAG: hypothetical protein CMH83_12935 [Nocardioides sp.]|nr:hypothetical protein [Nocardioides sp.]
MDLDGVAAPATGARSTTEVLVEAATAVPWPVDGLEEHLVAWAAQAVPGRVSVTEEPVLRPACSLLFAPARYLTVVRDPGEPEISPAERRLLVAVATMATASLDAARNQDRLEHRAVTDDLTGLTQVAWFHELFDGLLTADGGDRLAVLFCDLDRFKQLNEQIGHLDADEVLREIGRRLRDGALPDSAVVGRVGGDEFAAVVSGVDHADALARLVRGLRSALSAPVTVGDRLVSVDVSVGGALSAVHGRDADTLLRAAERAMRRAKRTGPAPRPPRWYDDRAAVQAMLDEGRVEVAYQPVVDLHSGRFTGCEALVRPHHGQEGPLSPVQLVETAARLGMLDEVTEAVLGPALDTVTGAAAAAGRGLVLSVNVEFEQLRPGSALLESVVERVAGRRDVSLVLEVTERQDARWSPEIRGAADRLAEAGVGLAVDDLGAGFSGLPMLTTWPWEWVKLDRGLVAGASDERGRVLLRHVAAMLAELGLTPVAEGVETHDELALVREAGLRLAQGRLLAPPLEADAMLALARADAWLLPGPEEPPAR